MDTAGRINKLMTEIFALQDDRKKVGVFQFGKAAELDRQIKAKRDEYTKLVKENMDDLELHRTCKRCGTEWYANAGEMLGLRNRAVAVTILGAVSGAYAQTATTNEILGERIKTVNACPNCKSQKFDELWA